MWSEVSHPSLVLLASAIGALGTWLLARRIGQLITRVDVLIGTFVGVAREAEKLIRTQRIAESGLQKRKLWRRTSSSSVRRRSGSSHWCF